MRNQQIPQHKRKQRSKNMMNNKGLVMAPKLKQMLAELMLGRRTK